MKPNVFSEKWEDVMYNLRDASKILLHFYTLLKVSETRESEISNFFYELNGRIPEEDSQLIFGGSADMAAKLIEYSNEILNFYTDPGNQFIDESDYVDILKENLDIIPKVNAYNFLSCWCIPEGKLSDEEYTVFVDSVMNTECSLPFVAYKVLRGYKYDEFLKTKYWMAVSRFVREKVGKCEECGATTNLHVHHLSYENHGCEHEHLDDLKCLCKDCHLKTHHELNKKS